MTEETIKPELKQIPGFEGIYSIDAAGNVSSDEREVTKDDGSTKIRKQRAVKHSRNAHGSTQVVLARDGKRKTVRVYSLLMETWGDEEVAGGFLAESDNAAGRGKTYEFVNPDGEYVKIVGLSKFCEANDLHASNMCQVHAEKISSCKGWTKYKSGEPVVTQEANSDTPEVPSE